MKSYEEKLLKNENRSKNAPPKYMKPVYGVSFSRVAREAEERAKRTSVAHWNFFKR